MRWEAKILLVQATVGGLLYLWRLANPERFFEFASRVIQSPTPLGGAVGLAIRAFEFWLILRLGGAL